MLAINKYEKNQTNICRISQRCLTNLQLLLKINVVSSKKLDIKTFAQKWKFPQRLSLTVAANVLLLSHAKTVDLTYFRECVRHRRRSCSEWGSGRSWWPARQSREGRWDSRDVCGSRALRSEHSTRPARILGLDWTIPSHASQQIVHSASPSGFQRHAVMRRRISQKRYKIKT